MPAVSVIIPNYNHERFLEQRIESVLNQTYRDFEVILMDDYSTDNSREIIEKYRKHGRVRQVVFNEENSGSTFLQWKKGIALAKSEYIWIAESDDYADPEFLAVVMKPLLEDSQIVISYCRSWNANDHDHVFGMVLHADRLDPVRWTQDYVVPGHVENGHYLKYRNTIPNASAVVFKKPLYIDSILDTDMKFCGDWLFWRNLLNQRGSKIAYTSRPLNFFRMHSQTTRALTSINPHRELKRFREYRSFVPLLFLNVFDIRFRWMMDEWIDRGNTQTFKSTRYQFLPVLHPVLWPRYYAHMIKKYLLSFKRTCNA
jgi:glycosyltransferase involved in cell wall biosynthesis